MPLRTLIIMRHAKSAWDSEAPNDFLRPLSVRGHNDAEVMARWLATAGYGCPRIVSSPAVRARQTAEIVAAHLDPHGAQPIEWCEAIYEAGLADLLGVVRARLDLDSLMLVGHNPGVESLVRYLDPDIDAEVPHAKLLPTAGLFAFRLRFKDGDLGANSGRLLVHQRPATLGPRA